MARGKKTGGRQKGAKNIKTAEAVAAAEATGIMPLDYMLNILRDGDASKSDRFAAAQAAAPYCHAKLSSGTLDGKFTGKMIVEWSKSEE